jgi:hypothetical protein
MAREPWNVPDVLASKARTVHAAAKAAEAVFECRLLFQLLDRAGLTAEQIDAKLHGLELAYHRRCDELGKDGGKLEKKLTREGKR